MTFPIDLQGSNPTSNKEAWERWVVVWHVVFYLTLAIPTVLALLSKDIQGSTQLVSGLSLAQGTWYGLIMVWFVSRYRGRTMIIWILVYLVVAIALWIPLARAHPAFYLTASSFYGLMWGTLPFGLAVAGNLLLTGVIIWLQGYVASIPVSWSWEMVIYGVVTFGWSILLAAWMRSVMRESLRRKSLIEQLEIAQHDLAVSERQAGILQERQRMAQEIHDTLAQDFTSIILQLEAADELLHNDLKASQRYLQQSRDIARSGLGEARRLVQALRPEALEKVSLPEALERTSARWARENGIALNYLVTGDPCSLHPEVEVTILRAMQEALANVYKHAQAQETSVTISYMEDKVVLDVHDDGIGFDPQALANLPVGNQGGFGLHSMGQRATQLGGKVVVESSPGKGTTVAVQIPYTRSAPTTLDSIEGLAQ